VRGSGTQFIQPGRPDDVVRLLVGCAAQLTAWPGSRQEAGPRLWRLDLDDLIAHRQQQTEQLSVLGRGDVELIERPLQILDERVELAGRDSHRVVRLPHAPAGVGMWTSIVTASMWTVESWAG
jgi:hypothetical protein